MCFIALMDLHLLFDMMIVGICFCMLQILNANRAVFVNVILHQVYGVISVFLFLIVIIGKVNAIRVCTKIEMVEMHQENAEPSVI